MTDLFPTTQGPASILSHHAESDAVDSFIAWRKARKKPLTDRAAKMVAKTLADINAAGGDATEALDLAQERGWLTVKFAWYFNSKEQDDDSKPTGNDKFGAAGIRTQNSRRMGKPSVAEANANFAIEYARSRAAGGGNGGDSGDIF